MIDETIEKEKKKLTPEKGFNLVGVDYFGDPNGQLYLIENFELYQDALKAKNNRKKPEEFLILYKGSQGEFLSR